MKPNTNEMACLDLVQAYLAKREINLPLHEGNQNPFMTDAEALLFCEFLSNYFKIVVPQIKVVACGTVKALLSLLEKYLPQDRTRFYYHLAMFYRVLLLEAREEMYEFHHEYLTMTRKLRKEMEEIEDLVMDFTDENCSM